MTAPTQTTLGQVPAGWLATTNPDGTAPVYKMGRDGSGQVTATAWPDAGTMSVIPAEQLGVAVFAMPDPNEAAQTAPPVTPAQAVANVQQAFPQATPLPSAAPAQQVPETGQAGALSPLVRATLALFDANTMPAVAGAPELAEAFKTAAFAVGRGPRGPRTIEALNRLLDARSMAALALFEPNA